MCSSFRICSCMEVNDKMKCTLRQENMNLYMFTSSNRSINCDFFNYCNQLRETVSQPKSTISARMLENEFCQSKTSKRQELTWPRTVGNDFVLILSSCWHTRLLWYTEFAKRRSVQGECAWIERENLKGVLQAQIRGRDSPIVAQLLYCVQYLISI